MKATKLLIAAAAFAGLASLSFAGPGIEYWNRMAEAAKNRPAIKAKAEAPAPAKVTPAVKPAAEVAATCATCSCCQGARKS